MKERLAGFLLMCAIVPLAILGYLLLWWVGLFGKTDRGRAGVRALDHFVNATLFNGYAWESVSFPRLARARQKMGQGSDLGNRPFPERPLLRSNKREQRIVDLVLKKGLDKRTID